MSESLLEYTTLHDTTRRSPALRIDRTAHRLRSVKILGFASTNGRTYELEAVRRALPLYEGARVNINHPPGAAPAPRDYHDRLGSLVDVRLDETQGLFGDLFYNPKHPLVEQLLWDAEHAPHHVGLSHNVLARTARRGDQTAVTEIVAVVSVDLVADPATTRGLFEEQESLRNEQRRVAGDERSEDPEEQMLLNRGLTSPAQEERTHPTSDDPEQAELDTLRAQVAAARLLREAGLPEPNAADPAARALVDAAFWESLVACDSPELQRERIAARVELIRAARSWTGLREDTGRASGTVMNSTPRSREQAAESLSRGPQPTREQTLSAFVAAVKRK